MRRSGVFALLLALLMHGALSIGTARGDPSNPTTADTEVMVREGDPQETSDDRMVDVEVKGLTLQQLDTLLQMGRAQLTAEANLRAEKRKIAHRFIALMSIVIFVASALLGLHIYLRRKDPD